MDYTDLEQVRALVTEKTGLAPSDLDTLLQVSAGIKDGVTTFYRPYFVCAVLLDTQLHTRKLISGEGAVFDNPSITVRGFLDLQRAIDLAENLEVPPGMEATYKNRRKAFRASGAIPAKGRW